MIYIFLGSPRGHVGQQILLNPLELVLSQNSAMYHTIGILLRVSAQLRM